MIYLAFFFASKVGYKPPDEYVVGDVSDTSQYRFKFPMDQGDVSGEKEWNDFEKILQHAFKKELQIQEQHPVLFAVSPWSSDKFKQKLGEVLFEMFTTPMISVPNQALLALCAAGQITGVVVDIGETTGHVVPIHNTSIISGAKKKMPYAGRDLTNFLIKILIESITFSGDIY